MLGSDSQLVGVDEGSKQSFLEEVMMEKVFSL